MIIDISNEAKQRLTEILSDSSSLLISVATGGCNGFSYNYEITKDLPENSTVVMQHPPVVVANSAIDLISGSVLKYQADDLGTSFFAIVNPNATSKCGCGNSFSTF